MKNDKDVDTIDHSAKVDDQLLGWQTIKLSNGDEVRIQERVLKILGGAEIVLLRATHQTDAQQEQYFKGRQKDLMAKVKQGLMYEMSLQIIKIAPIVQVEIPMIEGLAKTESGLHLAGHEKRKRYMTQIPVLVPKDPKKPGEKNGN